MINHGLMKIEVLGGGNTDNIRNEIEKKKLRKEIVSKFLFALNIIRNISQDLLQRMKPVLEVL